MKISKIGEQAIRALMELAWVYPGKPLTLGHISTATDTSVKFLEQILLLLRRGRFVQSLRGNKGGFTLCRDPREIVLGDVIRFLEGPLGPLGSKEELETLMEKSRRHGGLYSTLLDIRNACSGILDHRTLWDICQISQEMKQSHSKMYYI